MQQPGNNVGVRRVASQPQPLNQSSGHLGMQPGASGMNMGMNPQTSMPAQLRQVQQQQHQHQHQHQQMNMRLQQHQPSQSHIPPEIAMALRQGNANLSQSVARTASAQAQLLGNLTQPPTLTQAHAGGIQSSHQNNFQNSIPLPLQHQQPQISSSPRPGSHSQTHTPSNMSMNNQGHPQNTTNRNQITPDTAMFMNFQNPPFSQTPHTTGRLPPNNAQFPFVPSSTSPSQHGDIPQSISSGLGNSIGSGNRVGFHPTPAQQFEQMQQTSANYDSHFNISPPQSNIPPRPPSHNNHQPPGPLPQQQQQSQQHDHMAHLSQRPQSEPTTQPGMPQSQPDPSHTPRVSQPPLPTNHLSSGRIPTFSQSQHGGSPSHQPQLSGSGHPLPVNSRASLSAASGSSSSTVSSSSVPPSSEVVPLHGQINTRSREM